MTLAPDGRSCYCGLCGLRANLRAPHDQAHPPLHVCQASDPAAVTARMRAEIDAAIDRGAMGPLASFGLDRGELERRLARCEQCPELAPAGCRNVQPPCKQWTLWRQSLLLGSCPRLTDGNSPESAAGM